MPENNKNLLQTMGDFKALEYTQAVAEIMSLRKRGQVPLAYIRTYGCQQNVADSQKIQGMLSLCGFEFADTPDDADLILFNTCAVREHAEDRVFGNVGALKNLKRSHPSITIALCGCMMEQKHIADRIYKSFPFVNLVFGTHSIHNFAKLYYECLTYGKRIIVAETDDRVIHEEVPVKRDGEFKAFVPIMYGCDNFCSYCIVPHVRGREKSRSSASVLADVKQLINDGYKDITLLGQNVNSYGKGLEENITFAELLRQIDAIPGDYRLRFMTSHPKDCSKELIDTIAGSEHIERHLHLPFQSGSDRILKAMNRKYTRQDYIAIAAYAKEKIPELQITSDVIVGFPGETYEDFAQTLTLVEEVGFSSLYTFIFSPRAGTEAFDMQDETLPQEKSNRFAELLKLQEEISHRRSAAMQGQTVKVLVESKTDKPGMVSCRTSGNIIIEAQGEQSMVGTFKQVQITSAGNYVLKGIILD
ncbi:MAG: tRNA (N6-isopentenyl adenosine(37)-C2)-methylthiotransferase MiaB [Oscillospiraceae bacterium]|nr:tRNA (N6-isopentenyl adenosine(37)-C2)-methylthiotransferase MiaB [Oscillospiraceae bacterium]